MEDKYIKSYEFLIKIKKKDIDIFNKIIDALDGVASVRISDKKQEIIRVITTMSYVEETKKILEMIREYNIEFEILKNQEWSGIL